MKERIFHNRQDLQPYLELLMVLSEQRGWDKRMWCGNYDGDFKDKKWCIYLNLSRFEKFKNLLRFNGRDTLEQHLLEMFRITMPVLIGIRIQISSNSTEGDMTTHII